MIDTLAVGESRSAVALATVGGWRQWCGGGWWAGVWVPIQSPHLRISLRR